MVIGRWTDSHNFGSLLGIRGGRIRALVFAFLLPLVICGLAGNAFCQIIADGHVDIGVLYEDQQLKWRWSPGDATSEGGSIGDLGGLYLPEQLSARVPDHSRYDGPTFPGNANVTGVGTGPLHYLPSNGNLNNAPFMGWSWDLGTTSPPQLSLSQWQNSRITVQLINAQMPTGGHFSMWVGSTIYMSTFNPAITNAANVPAGSNSFILPAHTHFNWGFTKPGIYDITVRASGTHNTHGFKSTDATFRFLVGNQTTPTQPASVVARYAYHSGWTGPGPMQWNALDTSAVLAMETVTPQTLSLANLINSSHGINGIALDIDYLGNAAGLSAADFQFQNSPPEVFDLGANTPANWSSAPDPSSISVTALSGQTSRILIQWPNGSIVNRWLRMTVKATANTGLNSPEVYYLGHLTGESTGESGGAYTILVNDILAVRADLSLPAGAGSRSDIDKSGTVLVSDILAVRSNLTKSLTNISVP